MDVDQTIYITLDIDWVCDEVIEYTAELLDRFETKATFFITHETHVLSQLQKTGFDLGIHPNFSKLDISSVQNTPTEIIRNLKIIVPESVGVRCHTLTRSPSLSALFKEEGFTHESNLFMPFQSGTKLLPYEKPKGLIQLTHNWGDYSFLASEQRISAEEYLNYSGMKILNFHPIHLFLNTNELSVYHRAKRYNSNYFELSSFVNRTNNGILQYFELLVKLAQDKGFVFDLLRNISI